MIVFWMILWGLGFLFIIVVLKFLVFVDFMGGVMNVGLLVGSEFKFCVDIFDLFFLEYFVF